MRYFTGIGSCLNKKGWNISKMPFARRTHLAEHPYRVSAFNRFVSYSTMVHTLDVLDFRRSSKNKLKTLSLKTLRN